LFQLCSDHQTEARLLIQKAELFSAVALHEHIHHFVSFQKLFQRARESRNDRRKTPISHIFKELMRLRFNEMKCGSEIALATDR
jgi:hypothetical protein